MAIQRLKGKTLKSSSVVLAAAAALLACVSFAWACTPSAHIQASRLVGSPGSEITVIGKDFAPGAPVEIRWNSAEGKLVGSATGPEFSVPVTIPAEATSDVYYIVAVQHDLSQGQLSHALNGRATATFEVVASGLSSTESRSTGSDLWSGLGRKSPGSLEAGQLAPSSSSGGAPLMAGAALLVTGMVLVGAVIAVSRKSRLT